MTDETLRSKTRLAIWLAVAICLVPLVPYALRGGSDQAPAQGEVQPAMGTPAPAAMQSY